MIESPLRIYRDLQDPVFPLLGEHEPEKDKIRDLLSAAVLQVPNVAALQGIDITYFNTGTVCMVLVNDNANMAHYQLDKASTQLHDGRSAITPTGVTGAGRWLRVDQETLLVLGIGQSNMAQTNSWAAAPVAAGAHPDRIVPLAGTYTRANAAGVDTVTFTGPSTFSAGVRAYNHSGTSLQAISSASLFSGGKNNTALGTAVALHDETDNPVIVDIVAEGSHPIERFRRDLNVAITGMTLSGSVVYLNVNDIRYFQSETAGTGQIVDIIAPSGMPSLNGRFRVERISPTWDSTRAASAAVAGTLRVQDISGGLFNGTGLPAWTSGGAIYIGHLAKDIEDHVTQLATLVPNVRPFIVMSQSEANGGALDGDDLWTTVGGYTRDFAEQRIAVMAWLRSMPYLQHAIIVWEEAARLDANAAEKPRNLDVAESAGLAPNVAAYSNAGYAMADGDVSHFANHFGIGYHNVARLLLAMWRGGKTDIPDPAFYRWGRTRNGHMGWRHGYPLSHNQAVHQFVTADMGGRPDWNGQMFYSRSARLELNTADMTAADLAFGGSFSVAQWSITGATPNGSGGTDATAAGRTAVVASGFTFINTSNAVESTGIFYIDAAKTRHEFVLVNGSQIYVHKH